MDDLTVEVAELGRLVQLGKGGTAVVYTAPDFTLAGVPGVVFKKYKQATRAQAGPALLPGLLNFVRFRERLELDRRRHWDERINWPLRVVVSDGGAAAGVLLPLIPAAFFQRIFGRSGTVSRRPREVDALFGQTTDMTRIGFDAVDVPVRLGVVAQIAATYGLMHSAGVVVGDVSGRNVIYDIGSGRPMVLAVDADSARVEGTRSVFSSQPHTPYWEPPEALHAARGLRQARQSGQRLSIGDSARLSNAAATQNKATDVFKFALMVVRILDHGRGRAVRRDPGRAAGILHARLGPEAVRLLRRSLADAPDERPTMTEWYDLTHPGGRARATGPISVASAVALPKPAIAAGQVNGAWVYVDGTGWVRSPANGGRP